MSGSLSDVRLSDAIHVARMQKASDVHFAVGSSAAIRVDGRLAFLPGPPLRDFETSEIARTLFGSDAMARLAAGDDISTTWRQDDAGNVRVHAFRTRDGLSLALRLLADTIPVLESLHLPPVVSTLIDRPHGLLIFAGPTGSGKSTSLAALIDKINATRERRIITIEDPIEYRHESKRSLIGQREVGRDTPTYAKALVGALRADPDVIMLGELRDAETMRAALTASETGHLVLATLHTGDAPQSVDRIIDAFSGSEQSQVRVQLSQVLIGIVCQRLVTRASGNGRRVAAEVLVATDAVRNLVREGRTHQLRNVMLTGREAGMQTLEHHLSALLVEREIDPSAALASTAHRADVSIPSPVSFA